MRRRPSAPNEGSPRRPRAACAGFFPKRDARRFELRRRWLAIPAMPGTIRIGPEYRHAVLDREVALALQESLQPRHGSGDFDTACGEPCVIVECRRISFARVAQDGNDRTRFARGRHFLRQAQCGEKCREAARWIAGVGLESAPKSPSIGAGHFPPPSLQAGRMELSLSGKVAIVCGGRRRHDLGRSIASGY